METVHGRFHGPSIVQVYTHPAAPYPTKIIGVQIAELQLKQPNLG